MLLQAGIESILKKNLKLENLIPKMGDKAPGRWYPILMSIVCIRLVLQATISFRAAPKAIHAACSQFAALKRSAKKCLVALGVR